MTVIEKVMTLHVFDLFLNIITVKSLGLID